MERPFQAQREEQELIIQSSQLTKEFKDEIAVNWLD